MQPWVAIAAGAVLVVGGFLFALMEAGVLLIADKPGDPQKYALEVGTVWALLLLGVAAMAGGGWLVRKGVRARRAAGRGR